MQIKYDTFYGSGGDSYQSPYPMDINANQIRFVLWLRRRLLDFWDARYLLTQRVSLGEIHPTIICKVLLSEILN